MLSTQNVSIVNPIMQKLHALGFTQVQRPVNNPQVAGRISHFATNWKTITEDQWVLRTVQGFLIPFREEPRQVRAPQPCRFSEDQMKLLREEVSSLLGKGAVVTVEPASSEGAQDRRSDEVRDKPKSAELLGLSPALQDGGYPYVTGNSSTRRMACQVGSEGRLLHSANPSGSLEVPSLHGGPSSLPIHMSAVRSVLCYLGFYQGAKASFCFPEKCRSSPYR